jgi:hypothetical protein
MLTMVSVLAANMASTCRSFAAVICNELQFEDSPVVQLTSSVPRRSI